MRPRTSISLTLAGLSLMLAGPAFAAVTFDPISPHQGHVGESITVHCSSGTEWTSYVADTVHFTNNNCETDSMYYDSDLPTPNYTETVVECTDGSSDCAAATTPELAALATGYISTSTFIWSSPFDTVSATNLSHSITGTVNTVLVKTFLAIIAIVGSILAVLLAWKYINKFFGSR